MWHCTPSPVPCVGQALSGSSAACSPESEGSGVRPSLAFRTGVTHLPAGYLGANGAFFQRVSCSAFATSHRVPQSLLGSRFLFCLFLCSPEQCTWGGGGEFWQS